MLTAGIFQKVVALELGLLSTENQILLLPPKTRNSGHRSSMLLQDMCDEDHKYFSLSASTMCDLWCLHDPFGMV
jgi:hypothetical protein